MPRALSRTSTALFVMLSITTADAQSADRILWSVAWNSDGSQFAVGGVNTLWLFDAKTFERKSLLSAAETETSGVAETEYATVTSVSWHPFRKLLAVSSQGGNVNGIYDIDAGNRIPLKLDHGRGVAWKRTGDVLAMSSPGDGRLRIWNSEGALLHDIPRYKDARGLTGVAWSPSGDRLVTLGKYLTLHDANGVVVKQVTHRPDAKGFCLLLCAEWHPSGEFLAVGDYGNPDTGDPPTLQFWTAHGELMKEMPVNGGAEFRNVSWNRDGTMVASASDKLRIWTKAGELKHEGDSPDVLWGVAWRPDGDRILTSSIEGRVTLWTSEAKVSKRIVEVKAAAP